MLWRDLKAWQIYGANTDVGKTIISTVLCKAFQRRAAANSVLYLKPVSTGPQDEADDRHIKRHAPDVVSKCISQFSQPLSPHLAARIDADSNLAASSDKAILAKIKRVLAKHVDSGGRFALLETAGGVLSPGPSGTVQADLYRPLRFPSFLIGDSKLGGIGTTISAFESLHIRGYDVDSVLLFDNPKWGNYGYLKEHFLKHNVQTHAIPLPPERRTNPKDDDLVLAEYYEDCATSPLLNDLVDMLNHKHFSRISKLTSLPTQADSVIWHPFRQHGLPQNVIAIDSAYGDHFLTYNQETDPALASLSNSSTGLTSLASTKSSASVLTPLFDASASWWTQGLGHGNPTLSLTAAHAAGRYGHVMFASAVHEPALDLSYNLLSTLRNPKLSRVFFTDNGSTGMEVAVKMALRATCQRYGWQKEDSERPIGILGLKGSYHGDTIGVMNCSEPSIFNDKVDWYKPWGYWFDPPSLLMRKGKWELEIPTSMLDATGGSELKKFNSLSSIFDFESRKADEDAYRSFITTTLADLVKTQNLQFGALILEPLLMGAGGMIFVDPLFQRTLITTIRENPSLVGPTNTVSSTSQNPEPELDWSGLPIIADEVFTGLYRLGRASSSSFISSSSVSSSQEDTAASSLSLDIAPDISVHAKLLTGGLLPLAITTASNSIFNTFLSASKTDALLHGHSYTAHPIGCAVANKSLDELNKLNSGEDWENYRRAWASTSASASASKASEKAVNGAADFLSKAASTVTNVIRGGSPTSSAVGPDTSSEASTSPSPIPNQTSGSATDVFSFFSPNFLSSLSYHPKISGCFALGTVLVMKLASTPAPTSSATPASPSPTIAAAEATSLPTGVPKHDPSTTTSASSPQHEQEQEQLTGKASSYNSNAAASLQSRLLTTLDEEGCGIHSRVLGDVLYVMTSLTTSAEQVGKLEKTLLKALNDEVEAEDD